jgi:hypothetical protein
MNVNSTSGGSLEDIDNNTGRGFSVRCAQD